MGSDGYRLAAEFDCAGDVILEIGAGRSTRFLASLPAPPGQLPPMLVSIDLDPNAAPIHPNVDVHIGRAEELLTRWHEPAVGSGARVCFAWIDGHDWPYDDLSPDVLGRVTDDYQALGLELSKPASRRSHLTVARLLAPWVAPGGVVAFDDTWRTIDGFDGKGGLAVPWLLDTRDRDGPLFELWRVQDDTEPWRHNAYVAVRRIVADSRGSDRGGAALSRDARPPRV